MFDHWYALDAGGHQIRLYDYQKQVEIEWPNVIAIQNDQVIACAKEALEYIYTDQRKVQVRYPLEQGHLLCDMSTIILKMISSISSKSIFRPSFMVSVPTDLSEQDKQKWEECLAQVGAKHMELISNMEILQTEKPCFMIHSGHTYTELGICAHGHLMAHKTIHFAGKQIDESIQKIVAQKTRCLITPEDACALKEAASNAFWEQKNPVLSCVGLDRFQKYVRVQIYAMDLWPCMEATFRQIVLWAKQYYGSLGKEYRGYVEEQGILLSGGLASCFGLRQLLKQGLDCRVFCTNEPKYDMIEVLKAWR